MRFWLVFLAFTGVLLGLAACASHDPSTDNTPQQSTIPWNRPQSWEGAGSYGSAINQQQ